jgi:hypothetical protein
VERSSRASLDDSQAMPAETIDHPEAKTVSVRGIEPKNIFVELGCAKRSHARGVFTYIYVCVESAGDQVGSSTTLMIRNPGYRRIASMR